MAIVVLFGGTYLYSQILTVFIDLVANNQISFKVKGNGKYMAGANGDPTSLESFQTPTMKVFNGMMTAIIASDETPGTITLEATAKGLKKGSITIIGE